MSEKSLFKVQIINFLPVLCVNAFSFGRQCHKTIIQGLIFRKPCCSFAWKKCFLCALIFSMMSVKLLYLLSYVFIYVGFLR